MNEIWWRTWDRFKRHPALWLPVLAADLGGYGVLGAMGWVNHGIVRLLVGRASVLGGPPEPIGFGTKLMVEAALLTTPVTWISYFLRASLFAVAMVLAGAMVWFYEREQELDAAVLLLAIRRRAGKIMGVSSMVFALALAAMLLLSLTFYLGGASSVQYPWVTGSVFAMVLMGSGCWIVGPSLLKLTWADGAGEASREQIRQARYFLLGALAVSFLIFLACLRWDQVVAGPGAPFRWGTRNGAITFVASVLSALPYAVLSVALAVMGSKHHDVRTDVVIAVE